MKVKASQFKKLKGVTIEQVSFDCVNMLMLIGSDGNVYLIEAENDEHGIPTLSLSKHKQLIDHQPLLGKK